MPVSNLEVIDSAVKIGLGALIAGLSSITTAIITGRHARRKEVVQRRLDILQKCTLDFEAQCSNIQILTNSYHSYLSRLKGGHPRDDELARSHLRDFFSLSSKIPAATIIAEIQKVDALLITIGAGKVAIYVDHFREAAKETFQAIKFSEENETLPTDDDFGVMVKNIRQRRIDVRKHSTECLVDGA